MLPDAALLLHPMWRTYYVWRAPLAPLLYWEPFSDLKLLRLWTPSSMHFKILNHVTWRSFAAGCTLCDACTMCGKLRLLFFYSAVNPFPTVNSLLTMNSVNHTLWDTSPHYLMQLCCCTLCYAPTTCGEFSSLFFLLYCELLSDRELFTNHELQEASTLRYLILLPDTAYTKYRHFGVSHQNEGGWGSRNPFLGQSQLWLLDIFYYYSIFL